MARAIKDLSECYVCEVCGKTKKIDKFYRSNNLEKYPEGHLHRCKDCTCLMVDNWNPDTYLWILQECDVPYVPTEWTSLMRTYGADPSKLKGSSIVGRYLAKMKLNQWGKCRWKDTGFIQKTAEEEIKASLEQAGADAQQITETLIKSRKMLGNALADTSDLTPIAAADVSSLVDEVVITQKPVEPARNESGIKSIMTAFDVPPAPTPNKAGDTLPTPSDYFEEENLDELEQQLVDALTPEQRMQFRMKWGKAYQPIEWIKMEQLYQDMEKSFDITTASHRDTLRKVCKVSLKADQLTDLGDIDGAQKMHKIYNDLMKSGNFQATQNKKEETNGIDSVSQLVSICEAEGFIPRYYVDEPKDRVDWVIKDMQNYTRSLIEGESNMMSFIERAVRNMVEDKVRKEQNKGNNNGDELDPEALFADDEPYHIDANEMEEYNSFLDNEEYDDEDDDY